MEICSVGCLIDNLAPPGVQATYAIERPTDVNANGYRCNASQLLLNHTGQLLLNHTGQLLLNQR
jgi:hypothetical protein